MPGAILLIRRARRGDALLAGTVLALTIGTILMFAMPGLRARIVAPALDLVLDSVALVVTFSVAALSWVRYREQRQPFALYQATAFFVLAVANAQAVVVTIGFDVRAPLLAVEPGQDQLYVFTVARMLAAGLLVLGGISTLAGRQPRYPVATVVIPTIVLVGVAIVVRAIPGSLASLIVLPAPSIIDPSGAPGVSAFGAVVHVFGAALFGAAVVVSWRLWLRGREISDAYVTFGLTLAAFAQLHGVFSPSTHPGPVATGDLLRLGFDVALLLAIEAGARSVMVALRVANEELVTLRESEVARATLEERAWLSRELHDGLAQDLWLAKLKIGRLAGLPTLGDDARALVDEAGGAIDLGLVEARQAVATLRLAAESGGSFGELMTRFTEDFEDRFGLRVELTVDGLEGLSVRAQAELMRIAQEALANTRRHADATVVRVRAGVDGDRAVLSIIDNGRGFDMTIAPHACFGIAAMRERAALISGHITIESALGEGTRVSVSAPLGALRPRSAVPA